MRTILRYIERCGRPRAAMLADASGVSYVMVLFTIAVLGTVALSFVTMTGLETNVASNYANNMRAHYLARAGLNVGIWGVLNVPDFTNDYGERPIRYTFDGMPLYFMVKEANLNKSVYVGSYGNVGGAVSTFQHLTVPSSQAPGDPVIYLAYDTAIGSGDRTPKYREFTNPGWGPEGNTVDVGNSTVRYLELEGSATGQEMVMGTIDQDDDLNVAVWDGMSWGNRMEFTADSASWLKCFDIAYESQSGDALVVGRSGNSSVPRYTLWEGSVWVYDPPASAPDTGTGSAINVVVMASDPFSDEILVAFLHLNDDIVLFRWDGNSFTNLGTIETKATTDDLETVDIAYEQQSGDALIVWGKFGSDSCKYRIWDGSGVGPEGDLPSFGRHANTVRMSADPTSDYIFVAAVDGFSDLNVAVWDGGSWIDSRELDTSVSSNNRHCYDVAWESSGNEVVVSWFTQGENQVRYFRWEKGTPLATSTVEVGPVFQNVPVTLQLFSVSGTDDIILVGCDYADDLSYTLWQGDNFVLDPPTVLSADISVNYLKAYDLAEAGG